MSGVTKLDADRERNTPKIARAKVEAAITMAGELAKTSGVAGRRITHKTTALDLHEERCFLAATVQLARIAIDLRREISMQPKAV